MKISSRFLNRITALALYDFFKKEYISIVNDVSERHLCARLAISFENIMKYFKLHGYYADVEYNRKQAGDIKTIFSETMTVVTITCDLIIHSRGENSKKDNLIAIEMAKPNKPRDTFQHDRERLMALTKTSYDGVWSNDGTTHPEHVCGYMKGFYLIIDKNTEIATVESYAQGAPSMPPYKISLNPRINSPVNPHYFIRQRSLMIKKLTDRPLSNRSMLDINKYKISC